MSTTATLIAGRATQRLILYAEVGAARANLTGKTLQCQLAGPEGQTPQSLTATPSAQSGATMGQFTVDVTLANLTALSAFDQLLLSVHIWDPDNSLFLNRAATMSVEV